MGRRRYNHRLTHGEQRPLRQRCPTLTGALAQRRTAAGSYAEAWRQCPESPMREAGFYARAGPQKCVRPVYDEEVKPRRLVRYRNIRMTETTIVAYAAFTYKSISNERGGI